MSNAQMPKVFCTAVSRGALWLIRLWEFVIDSTLVIRHSSNGGRALRIVWSGVLGTMGALFALGCNGAPEASSAAPPKSRVERIDRALAAAAHYLVARQSADGAWCSELKGPFKDGG